VTISSRNCPEKREEMRIKMGRFQKGTVVRRAMTQI
jgi:hypothetical protein